MCPFSDVRERPLNIKVIIEQQGLLDTMAVGAVRPCPVAAAFFAGLGPHPSPKEERATDKERYVGYLKGEFGSRLIPAIKRPRG